MGALNEPETLLRMGLAVFVGAIVGWERQLENKPAGLRTHMLVSLGASLFVLISVQTAAAQESADAISRVLQGIIVGIGFLGAGEIVQSQAKKDAVRVQGLTSAAAIWVAAALGAAAGYGLWLLSLSGAVFTLLILKFVKRIERSE